MISTQNLTLLPDIHSLKSLTQSLALLDAILCPDWQYRYYSFNANWDTDQGLASMRNGEGDHWFCLFNPSGAILKGFMHESPMSPFRVNPPQLWPGILDSMPPQFALILAEPAFAALETTFCIWRTKNDLNWQRGAVQIPDNTAMDGSDQLLAILDGAPQTYQHWAERYYDRQLSLESITTIYRHHPITDDVVEALNPQLSISQLSQDIAEIGYESDSRVS